MLDDEEKKRIVEALNSRLQKNNKLLECPICGNRQFTITDGYFNPVLQDELKTFRLGPIQA